jgi:uncharacterized protein
MISVDSNLLLYAFNVSAPWHGEAAAFLEDLRIREDVVMSEFVLVELYTLLRNPSVVERPLTAAEAVEVVTAYRTHPRWRLEGFPADSPSLHDALWRAAGTMPFARRRIYDARLALSLLRQGVRDFATANVGDFQSFGFRRVWCPLS